MGYSYFPLKRNLAALVSGGMKCVTTYPALPFIYFLTSVPLHPYHELFVLFSLVYYYFLAQFTHICFFYLVVSLSTQLHMHV